MNVKSAAVIWNISDETVRQYCREGFVEGAAKSRNGTIWEIPDDAICPLYFPQGHAKDQSGRLVLVLQAISQRKVIPFNKLNADADLMMDYIDILVDREVIRRRKYHAPHENLLLQYTLTEKGEQIVNENKTFAKIMKILAAHAPYALNTYNAVRRP